VTSVESPSPIVAALDEWLATNTNGTATALAEVVLRAGGGPLSPTQIWLAGRGRFSYGAVSSGLRVLARQRKARRVSGGRWEILPAHEISREQPLASDPCGATLQNATAERLRFAEQTIEQLLVELREAQAARSSGIEIQRCILCSAGAEQPACDFCRFGAPDHEHAILAGKLACRTCATADAFRSLRLMDVRAYWLRRPHPTRRAPAA
jgi:hypothetical protein